LSGSPPPVRARGLVKRYNDLIAVDHVDLNVNAGEVYGFLGPNGAGKTTTLRMLLGLIMPTQGTVELFGRNPVRDGARALAGVAGFVEAPRFYPYLSGRRNLEMMAALDGGGASARIDDALRLVDLESAADKRAGAYSHGMGQRLGIAAALLRRPQLLVLDEPATGLDPAGIRDMRLLIGRLAAEGMTVLLSSHQLAEVQETCDRVAIVRAGRVVYEGPLADLRSAAAPGYRMHTSDDARAANVARTAPGIRALTVYGTEIAFNASQQDAGALSLALGAAGVAIYRLAPTLASLEDLFFELTEGTGNGEGGNAADAKVPAAERAAAAPSAPSVAKQGAAP
jgi:ABC-2 type transport system ATP-binding protein